MCEDAALSILPAKFQPHSLVEMDHLVTALVQIDSAYGITPCQYRALKGIASSGGDISSSDFENKFDPTSIKMDDKRAKAIQEMYDSTGADHFSRPEDSAAYRAGLRAGQPLRNAAILSAHAIRQGFDNFGEIVENAWDTSIRQLGGAVRLFDDIYYDRVGKWLYKTGEIIDDVWDDSVANTYDFFNGMAVGLLGPSVAGRRRIAYDKDCDFIQKETDMIENECANYRYARFVKLVPAIQTSGRAHAQIMANRSRLNETFVGEIDSANPGLRELFAIQRDTLYGVNGSCLNPKPGSLAAMSSQLPPPLFRINNGIKRVFDSNWAALVGTNNHVAGFGKTVINTFSQNVGDIMKQTVEGYRQQRDLFLNQAVEMTNEIKETLESMAAFLNENFEAITRVYVPTENQFDDLNEDAERNFRRLENTLFALTGTLDITPSGLNRFTDTLLDGGEMLLRNGFRDSSAGSELDIKQISIPKIERLHAKFNQINERGIEYMHSDWQRALVDYLRELGAAGAVASRRHVEGAKMEVANQFNLVEAQILAKVSEQKVEQDSRFSELRLGYDQLAKTLKLAQQSAATTIERRDRLFEELLKFNAEKVSEMQRKIGQLISATVQAIDGRLRSTIDSVTNLGVNVRQAQNDFTVKLHSYLLRVRRAVASALVIAQRSAATKREVLRAAAGFQQGRTDKQSDRWNEFVSAVARGWENDGEKSANDLLKISQDSENEREKVLGVMTKITGILGGDWSAKARWMELEGVKKAGAARLAEITSGKSINTLAKQAGISSKEIRDKMNINRGGIVIVGRNMQDRATQNSDSVQTLLNRIAKFDEDAAGDFRSETRYVLDRAVSGSTKELDSLVARIGKVGVDFSNNVAEIRKRGRPALKGEEVDRSDAYGEIEDGLGIVLESSENRHTDIVNEFNRSLIETQGWGRRDAQRVMTESLHDFNRVSADVQYDSDRIKKPFKFTSRPGPELRTKQRIQAINDMVHGLKRIRIALEAAVKANNGFKKGPVKYPTLLAANKTITSQLMNLSRTIDQWRSSFRVIEGIDQLDWKNVSFDNITFRGFGIENVPLSSVAALDAAQAVSTELIEKLRERRELASSVWNFDGMENEVSGLRKKRQKMSEIRKAIHENSIEKLTDMNGDDFERRVKESVGVAATALGFHAKHASAEDRYKEGILGAQTTGIVKEAQRVADGVDLSAVDFTKVSADIVDLVGRMTVSLDDYMKSLHSDIETEIVKANMRIPEDEIKVLGSMISDQNQVKLQTMLVKRAVRDLLQSWGKFHAYQSSKFEKITSADAEVLRRTAQTIAEVKLNSSTSLNTSADVLENANTLMNEAMDAYVLDAVNTSQGELEFRSRVRRLNATVVNMTDHIKMSFLNSTGERFFDEEKTNAHNAVKRLDADLDRMAAEAIRSVR